jgi:hypothetical protein
MSSGVGDYETGNQKRRRGGYVFGDLAGIIYQRLLLG